MRYIFEWKLKIYKHIENAQHISHIDNVSLCRESTDILFLLQKKLFLILYNCWLSYFHVLIHQRKIIELRNTTM